MERCETVRTALWDNERPTEVCNEWNAVVSCYAGTLTRLIRMDTAHTVLSGWWWATGDEPRLANVGETTIQDIERRYGVTLPEDFRLYLLHAAPSDDFWDNGDAIWWSPERLKNIPENMSILSAIHASPRKQKRIYSSPIT